MGLAPQQISHSHLDALAQSRGFPDYNTWAAWNQHRTDAITQGSNTQADPQAGQQNFLQRLMGPIYPATMFKMIGDRYAAATGQQ
jgi:hypothetical protein